MLIIWEFVETFEMKQKSRDIVRVPLLPVILIAGDVSHLIKQELMANMVVSCYQINVQVYKIMTTKNTTCSEKIMILYKFINRSNIVVKLLLIDNNCYFL